MFMSVSKLGVLMAGLRRPVSANPQSSTKTNTIFGFVGGAAATKPHNAINHNAPIMVSYCQVNINFVCIIVIIAIIGYIM